MQVVRSGSTEQGHIFTLRRAARPAFHAMLSIACWAVATASLAADSRRDQESELEERVGEGAEKAATHWPRPATAPRGAPNVVLILLDDVGFSASSVFGGPVRTPALEELAAQGLRYNRFHVTAQCSPTRASLLSGRNAHRVGFGAVGEGAFPGYNTVWPRKAASIAEILRRNGYSTAAIGKWHNTPMWEIGPVGPFERWPTSLGFEYFYGFMGAADDQWHPYFLYRNTLPAEPSSSARQGYHLTADLADEAIRWIHTQQSVAPAKPYFLYFATGATHRPNQVAKHWIDAYRGQFDMGWDRLRESIAVTQKRLGVVPSDAALSPRPPEIPAWNSLGVDQRRLLTREMEIYAGFLAHTDYEVGRLIKAVRESARAENTLILYIAGDNGASSEAGPVVGEEHEKALLEHLDELGGPRYPYAEYSSGWAWAMSTPFQWQKLIASHLGGTRSPLVVAWPLRIKDRGGLRSQYTHVNDVAATLYDVIGIDLPHALDGVEQVPLDGVSFAESFWYSAAKSRHTIQVYEQWGNRAIYQDGWLASARHFIPWAADRWTNRDYSHDKWELYDLESDFSQAHDIASLHPDKLRALQAVFDAEAHRGDIYPLGGATPLGDASVLENPNYPTAGRRDFLYHSGLPRLPPWMAPDFSRSHRITADLVIPDEGAEGVIIANGSSYGGFSLYVKHEQLVYESSVSTSHVLRSSELLPHGRVAIAFEFVRQGSRDAVRLRRDVPLGTGRLYINGKVVAETTMQVSSISPFWGAFGIGQVYAPVGSSFSPPFKFTGTLNEVRVELD
jgi:arylsulfatase A-like enzyme